MSYSLIFTNVGLNKKANAELNNDYIDIQQFAVGSGVIADLQPTMTGLVTEEYRADINMVDTKNGTTVFDLVIPSDVGGFYIREVALYDIDGDCICIGTVPITYKVSQDEGASKAVHIKVTTVSTNTQNITFTTDNSTVYATLAYVDDHINNKQNPHEVTKTQVGLNNVDNTADSDKEVLSATKLKTARTISLTGEAEGSASFDGSVNKSITVSLVAAKVLEKLKTVHGATSGLDADLIDGVEGKYLMGQNFGSNTDNPNTTVYPYILTKHDKCPDRDNYWHIRTQFYNDITDTANVAQIAIQYSGGISAYVRNRYSGDWSSWLRIDNNGNAASATKLATARDITIGGKTLSFDGSAALVFTLAAIGAQAAGTYNTIIGTDTDINTSGATIIGNIYVTDGVITSMGTRTLTWADIDSVMAGMTIGSIGSIAFLRYMGTATPGTLIAGTSLNYGDQDSGVGASPSGTWMCLGYINSIGIAPFVRKY